MVPTPDIVKWPALPTAKLDPAAPHRAVVPPVFPTDTEAAKAANERLKAWSAGRPE
jgi:hypothetical protein